MRRVGLLKIRSTTFKIILGSSFPMQFCSDILLPWIAASVAFEHPKIQACAWLRFGFWLRNV